MGEIAGPWDAGQESDRLARRGHRRLRARGAGGRYRLALVDRVLATLAVMRLQLPHEVVAVLFGVDRSTITRAIRQVRPVLARRGYATPAGPRLHTLADVFAYAGATGTTLRVDGSEIQVRRPRAHRPGRRAFVSGKKKQNTIKFTKVCDAAGRTLIDACIRPGRMHDQTCVKTAGIDTLLDAFPAVRIEADAGYRGLRRDHPRQVGVPPLRPRDAEPDQLAAWEAARHAQSSRRICVEHANAHSKNWRSLQRWTGRRDDLPETILAIGSLVSDRAATR